MLKCPKCGHATRSGAKFCEECAAPLALTCRGCGTPLAPTAKFCPECAHPAGSLPEPAPAARFASPESYIPNHLAEKILTSKSAIEGERKQVTVLFADLKGSMELLADRDPEVARKLLDPVLELMMEAVHRYEGTVNQVMGDGIMALFGAPLAHEDHAIRACYAALRLQESAKQNADEVRRMHGIQIRVRVGLNSGEVVVRAIGSDLRMDYTAVGQTTHLAARMEQLADPGTVLMAPDTLALAEGFVHVKPLGQTAVKGLSEPIEIYELVGASPVRSRLQAAVSRGLTRFVGRDAEIERLRNAMGRACNGQGQAVGIIGEPGMGKSRLAWEFTHSHRTQSWLVLEGAAVSYGKSTTYFPMIELLRGYFGIEPRDPGRTLREKVTGKLLSLDRSLEGTLPVFLALLDAAVEDPEWVRLAPAQRKQKTQEALKRLVLRESMVQPVLMVIEDLHWIDSETQAFLDLLIESLPTAKLLLLMNYRPEYKHGWGGKSYYHQIGLDCLPSATSGELLEILLGSDQGLKELKKRLIERTEGNPFFLEESVRALAEKGALAGERGAYRAVGATQSLELPASARAILAARIDRLSPVDKRLLQAAAVIGKDVPFPLLQAIAEPSDESFRQGLQRLQAAEFLYESRLFPEIEYTFKHALSHEVALAGLLQERRRALHARILAAMEQLHAGRLGEHVERLAYHASRGEVPRKAVHYLRQAGLKAFGRSALLEARASFEQAIEVLEVLPESVETLELGFDIRLELRPALTSLGQIRLALARAREGAVIAGKLNDEQRSGRVFATMTSSQALLGELDEAIVSATSALEIAGRLSDTRLRILSTSSLAQAHYYRGDFERVVGLMSGNLALLPPELIYENFGNIAPASIFDRVLLMMSLAELGRFSEAGEEYVEAIRIAHTTHDVLDIGVASRAGALPHLLRGDWVNARVLIDQWMEALLKGNIALQLPLALGASAWVLAQLGETGRARERVLECEQHADELAPSGIEGYLGWAYFTSGRAALVLGMTAEARRLAGRAINASPRHLGYTAWALHLKAETELHTDEFDAASCEADLARALAIAEQCRMRPLAAHCHLAKGRLLRHAGRLEDARGSIGTAMSAYRDLEMPFWLGEAEAQMRQL